MSPPRTKSKGSFPDTVVSKIKRKKIIVVKYVLIGAALKGWDVGPLERSGSAEPSGKSLP